MEPREEKIVMYMSCLADYGFKLDPEEAYYVASRVVDGDVTWHDIWLTQYEEDRDVDEKPIGFIITTETDDAYGLLSVYMAPEFRGQLRAINAVIRLVRESDPDKTWIYQVRTDNEHVRKFLTSAMLQSGYKAIPSKVGRITEMGVPYAVYTWIRRPVVVRERPERKSKEELLETFNQVRAAIDNDIDDEPDFAMPFEEESAEAETEQKTAEQKAAEREDMPYDAMVADERQLGMKATEEKAEVPIKPTDDELGFDLLADDDEDIDLQFDVDEETEFIPISVMDDEDTFEEPKATAEAVEEAPAETDDFDFLAGNLEVEEETKPAETPAVEKPADVKPASEEKKDIIPEDDVEDAFSLFAKSIDEFDEEEAKADEPEEETPEEIEARLEAERKAEEEERIEKIRQEFATEWQTFLATAYAQNAAARRRMYHH